jgi:hypothetical protein
MRALYLTNRERKMIEIKDSPGKMIPVRVDEHGFLMVNGLDAWIDGMQVVGTDVIGSITVLDAETGKKYEIKKVV